jgi:hypothetical protein
MPINLELIEHLAVSLRKLMTAASEHLGADCMLHAKLAQRILQDVGITTNLVGGEAAWRVGPGDGDVITHSPRFGGLSPSNERAMPFHAWLEHESTIIDFSTHSLRVKAQELDAMDGGETHVTWCPPYIWIPKREALPLREVAHALNAGVSCYQEIPGLLEYMEAMGQQQHVDPENLRYLQVIFDNPEMQVVGPNQIDATCASLV